jgi:predicted nuclease of predicted toxin-antitoxin system
VRVVLDANLPVDFGALLTGHQVDSVHQRGWSDLDNGALLTACQAEYDAFVTLDQSLRYQQNLRGRPMAVLILHARSNRLQDLSQLVPALLAVLPTAPPGQVTLVGA